MTGRKLPYSLDELFSLGPQRAFAGENQNEIAFPLGGIGTGTVSLTGKGGLRDWEIWNRPNKGSILPYSFFTLYARAEGKAPVTRVLQAPERPPYSGTGTLGFSNLGFGVVRDTGVGLPHVDSCVFRGEYPFAWIRFSDRLLPVSVSLEAYNPFIPLNELDSGIPAAVFLFRLENPGRAKVEATLAANLFNAAGYPGTGKFQGEFLGRNRNRFVESSEVRGLLMTSEKYPATSPRFGSLALMTPWGDVTYETCWLRSGWWDAFHHFWERFSTTGSFSDGTGAESCTPSADGQSDVGSIGLKVSLDPGEHVELPVYITWYFPNFEKYWADIIGQCGSTCACGNPVWRNFYAEQFEDALDVAGYVAANSERLHGETELFHESLFGSTLPPYVLDAVSSQASIIRTPTCIRLEDGTFYGFEGCHAGGGCCEGSCTHVWNYAQAPAFLFPALERTMRDSDYAYAAVGSRGLGVELEQGPMGLSMRLEAPIRLEAGSQLEIRLERVRSGGTP